MKKYTKMNAKIFDQWINEGWKWGIPISDETYNRAKLGDFEVLLTPNKPVPKDWIGILKGKKVLGLASGGGQQMPIFQALGAEVVCLDISKKQLQTEKEFATKMGYHIELIEADMTDDLPFKDETFDMIFHPVSNVYIENVGPVFKEAFRILKKGGVLLSGLDNGINFAFDETDGKLMFNLPFNPLKDKKQYDYMVKNDYGIQFSHSIEDQIGGQLKAGFVLVDIYEDINESGYLKDQNIPTFYATKAVKPLK